MPAHPIRIGAAFWIQRTDWPSLRDAAVAAEEAGADDLWIDDHLLSRRGHRLTTPSSRLDDAGGRRRGHVRARLGLLVAANTFRNPGSPRSWR
jgi:alkanesulfonate monooxygenase SsuD/methylene tetrahydromethanopterin reductase-like flavin-dependent oxidoreductase (luciferase family)